MRWTVHMQECLQEIEARCEAPLYDALVQCVRVQLIADKAINSASLDVNIELDFYFRPPQNLFAQELLAQLGRLRSSMGTAIWQEGKLIPSALYRLERHSASETHCQPQTLTLPQLRSSSIYTQPKSPSLKQHCLVTLPLPGTLASIGPSISTPALKQSSSGSRSFSTSKYETSTASRHPRSCKCATPSDSCTFCRQSTNQAGGRRMCPRS